MTFKIELPVNAVKYCYTGLRATSIAYSARIGVFTAKGVPVGCGLLTSKCSLPEYVAFDQLQAICIFSRILLVSVKLPQHEQIIMHATCGKLYIQAGTSSIAFRTTCTSYQHDAELVFALRIRLLSILH